MHPDRPARRRAPLGLIGMLALVALIEAAEARTGGALSHPWAGDWRHATRAVAAEAPACRVLCFGDSLTKYGVVPRILEERLGGRAYNLALGAGPPAASLAMLERALAAGSRPEAILVDFAPHLLGVGPEISAVLLPEVLTPLDATRLGWDAGDPGLAASTALGWLLPTVKDRGEIRAAILGACAGEDRAPRRLAEAAARRNWEVNRGAHLAIRSPRGFADDAPWAKQLYPAEWSCTPPNAAHVRRFLRLAGRRAIPVFWLIPPFSPEVHVRRACSGLEERYTAFVARAVRSFPGVTVLDGRGAGYGVDVHADAIHLDRRGAAVFTEEVAAAVARRLGPGADRPGGWVRLPPYRDRPADAPLEDLLQSTLAVKDQGPAARR